MEQYERKFPHYRSHLAQKHIKKLNDKGIIDIQLSQLGIKKPFTARHYYIKEQVEVRGSPILEQHAADICMLQMDMPGMRCMYITPSGNSLSMPYLQ